MSSLETDLKLLRSAGTGRSDRVGEGPVGDSQSFGKTYSSSIVVSEPFPSFADSAIAAKKVIKIISNFKKKSRFFLLRYLISDELYFDFQNIFDRNELMRIKKL